MSNFYISIDTEPDLHGTSFKGISAGIPNLIKILDKYKIKATFFVTGDVLRSYPKYFKKLKKQGHEIAIHGYRHERLDDLSNLKKEENIRKSVELYKKIFNTYPKGFRAPQHSIDEKTLELLKKYGFKYDSSLTPWNFYHIIFFWKIKQKFLNNFKRMKPHKIDGFSEIPCSSLFFPFSSLTIRILPKFILKIYLYFISKFQNSIFLMHSWDLIDIPKSKISQFIGPKKFISKFDYSLNYLSKKGKFSILEKLVPPIHT